MLEITGTIIGTLNLALGGIAGVSLLVGGIGIMNIMLVSVAERTREIGIRKAVGARRKDVLWQFLLEAIFLALVGGVLGLLFAYIGSLVLKNFDVPSAITFSSIVIALIFSTIIGVIFGVYPAYRAASLEPIVALRYE
ncbi:MAG: Macrolide export ATP-binding/permease protein MacB [candidate division WS2 bacterium]|nr:Macrolide export ATP-binding/permease protein MacB [Candidatus Psychracetigena formicireducens]